MTMRERPFLSEKRGFFFILNYDLLKKMLLFMKSHHCKNKFMRSKNKPELLSRK